MDAGDHGEDDNRADRGDVEGTGRSDREDSEAGEAGSTTQSDTAAEAVASLANEIRLRTLLVLWAADDRPLRFSDLRERVGVRDPGQFRYHLRKLEDRFVRKTEDGYDITMAGVNVVWAVRSGDLTTETEVGPFPIDGQCGSCESMLSVRYQDGLLIVDCPSCGWLAGMVPFHPSGLVGRTEEDILATYEQVILTKIRLAAYNVCPRCYGPGTTELVTDESVLPVRLRTDLSGDELMEMTRYDPDEGVVDIVWTCSQCGWWTNTHIVTLLAFRPTVAEFYRDHGVDFASIRSWEFPDYLGNVRVTDVETEPLSLKVTVTLDDETLTVSVEDGFSTVTTVRSPASDSPPVT